MPLVEAVGVEVDAGEAVGTVEVVGVVEPNLAVRARARASPDHSLPQTHQLPKGTSILIYHQESG